MCVRTALSGGQALLGEEGADQFGDFLQSGLQQEMPAVEKMDFSIG